MVIAPTVMAANISMADSLILMVMALVVVGPRRLPQIGRQIGKLMYEFRKASNDFKFQMEEELRNAEEADRRKKEEERQRSLAAAAASEQASVSADPALQSQAVGSPYAGEEQYPPATDEPLPRIMPPSTGETVSAPRHTVAAEPSSPPSDDSSKSAGEAEQNPAQAQENAAEAL